MRRPHSDHWTSWRTTDPNSSRRVASIAPADASPASPFGDLIRDVVVHRARLAADQLALVLGVQDGSVDVLTGEGANGVDAVPQRQGDELGGAVVVAAEQPRSAVSRGSTVLGEAGLADVGGVIIGVGGTHRAAPGTGDHRSTPRRALKRSCTMAVLAGLMRSPRMIRMQIRPRRAVKLIAVCTWRETPHGRPPTVRPRGPLLDEWIARRCGFSVRGSRLGCSWCAGDRWRSLWRCSAVSPSSACS